MLNGELSEELRRGKEKMLRIADYGSLRKAKERREKRTSR
jgi:hypothetical protein